MARYPRYAEFFRIWTPVMAYVLGLWWTDGCMRIKKNTSAHEIEIASNDYEHLVCVAQAIGGHYHLRKVAKGGNTYKITFCSVEMYRDIERLGGSPRKSRIIGFPDVPGELLAHYVRGIVDGDGTLAWNGDRPVLQVYSGSTAFLNGLIIAVEQATGIPAPILQRNRDNWTVKWSTVRAKCLAAWLYTENPGLALQRKAEIAANFLQWHPKRTPDHGTITARMRENFPIYIGQQRTDIQIDTNKISTETLISDDNCNNFVQLQFSLE